MNRTQTSIELDEDRLATTKSGQGELAASTVNATEEIPRLTEHLFRHEAGKLVSILTGIFGIERLQLAEDVVQEALVRALQVWPYSGVPKNPAAWLTQTAKNLTLDVIRREKVFRDKEAQIAPVMEQWSSGLAHDEGRAADSELKDDGLRMMLSVAILRFRRMRRRRWH